MLNFPDKLALNRFNPPIRFILSIVALCLACVSAHAGVKNRTVTNSYDSAYRLATETIAETGGSSTVTAYQYDKGNNRTQKSITVDGGAAVVTNSTYGDTTDGYNSNQLKSATQGATTTTFSYDASGNRSDKKVNGVTAQTYSWDHENRLKSVTEASTGTFVYAYDHRTRRVLRNESQAGGQSEVVVFSGGTSVQEYLSGGSTPTVEYIRGSDYGGGIGGVLYTIRGSDRSYNAYNSRGDVVSQTDDSGAITWQSSYEAFGTRTQEQGATEDRQKANTKDEDPTGLLNEHYRYRDLEFGVFITRDPAGFVDGPNVYSYVKQNPWTMFDPLGLYAYQDINSDGNTYLNGKPVYGPKAEANGAPYADPKSGDLLLAVGSILPIPGAGEAGDTLVLSDPNSSKLEKAISSASLTLSAWTAGASPNAGAFFRLFSKSDEVIEGVAKNADNVAGSTAKEATEQTAKNVEEISPTNYPNPDPPNSIPAVKYDPKTDGELMRMRQGQGPTTKRTHGDQNIEAHHRHQQPTSEGGKIDEITQQQHRGSGNHTRHKKPSKLTPSQRRKEIKKHYKDRSKEYVTGGEGI